MARNKNTQSLIGGALRLSAHILQSRPEELPSQLQGRLLKFDEPRLKRLREQLELTTSWPWIKLHWPSLAAPAGALIQTLLGHTAGVKTVVLTPDGKRAVSASFGNTLRIWTLDSGECECVASLDAPAVALVFQTDYRLMVGFSTGRIGVFSLE